MNKLVGLSWAVVLLSLCSATPVLRSIAEEDPTVITAHDDVANYRLSTDVIPSHYEVKITPDMDNWTFEGHVIIQVETIEEDVREIVLHTNYLTIKTIKVYAYDLPTENLYEGLQYTRDETTHKLTIPLNTALEQGRTYNVEIEYSGEMRDDMAGFYRSTYMEDGVEKRLGSTQFQTTSARRAFPCFDEPKFKAVFDIKLVRTSQYNTISNTKIKEINPLSDDLFEDVYHSTPVMSTYLIAFIVSEYTGREDEKFGVWARPEMYAHSKYAYDVGVKLLDYFNSYTADDYYKHMDRMDMAAIPDFSAGAMENWGLLTYRESNLLYSADKTTALTKQRIAAVIAHEQAHMWFGDLITCDWWENTWLNEGFARYHQYMSTGMVETEWDMEYQFVVEQLQGVFQMDASNSTHPMNHEVNTPGEVSNIFDNISYNKGGSVIRMIEHLMGKEKFLAGIRQYIQDNALYTSVPSKLYDALQAQAGTLDIAAIMGSWADQEGYPVLTVEINEARTSAKLSQRRFLSANSAHTDDKLYPIPVTFATPTKKFEDTTHSLLMNGKEAELAITGGDSWVIFNTQQVGYYRVNYDDASWHQIHHALLDKHEDIHVLNRAQVVDDLLNLARGGLLDYQMAFDILDYLPKETDYIPWYSAVTGLAYISRRMAGEHSTLFGDYVKKTFEDIYQHLGFLPNTTDRQTDIYNRANVLQWLCKYQHEDCVNNAKAEFQKAQADDSYLVPVDIRHVVYCTAARLGDKDTYQWLWSRYLNEQMATEQTLLLNAMGCVVDEQILATHLGNVFSTAVRKQDKSAAFSALTAYHDENVDKVFNYLKNNHDTVVADLGSYGSLASYISGLGARFTRDDQIAALNTFAEAQAGLFGSSVSTLQSGVRTAQYEFYWDSKHLATIASIIDKKVNGGAIAMSCVSTILIAFGLVLNFLFQH